MSFGDRLGLVGVFLALIALAATYLWPDKKWIGWIALFCAVALLVAWGWLEFGAELPRLSFTYPIRTGIAVFIVGGCLALALWALVQPRLGPIKEQAAIPSETQAKKEVIHDPQLSPAGFVSFIGQVIDGQAPMMQENQTETPLDDVHLSIVASVPKSAEPQNDNEWGSGTVVWQKEIDIGTCRARLTTGLPERFPIAGQKYLYFHILMMTRLQSYRETIKLTKTSDKEYSGELTFFGGDAKPIYTRNIKLGIATLQNPQPVTPGTPVQESIQTITLEARLTCTLKEGAELPPSTVDIYSGFGKASLEGPAGLVEFAHQSPVEFRHESGQIVVINHFYINSGEALIGQPIFRLANYDKLTVPNTTITYADSLDEMRLAEVTMIVNGTKTWYRSFRLNGKFDPNKSTIGWPLIGLKGAMGIP
jgi:hypothetical protein